MSEASPAGRPAPQEFEKVLTAAAATQASFEEEDLSLVRRLQRFLHVYPTTVPLVVLVLGLLLGMVVNYSHFVSGSNLTTVLTQVTIIGILGIAQTLIILTAGIDLSVGVVMVLSSVVMGRLAVYDGVPTILAFLLGLLTGVACGYLNGALVTRLKMPPFIVTLGTLSIIRRSQHLLFAERNHSHAGYRSAGAVSAIDGHSVRDRQRPHHSRELPAHRAGGHHVVRAEPHRLRTSCLCDRR